MSWFPGEKTPKRTWLESLCINILKCGPIPNHLAFIMDGNRRFAAKLNMKHIQGHMQGFDTLVQTLEWCLELGITEVTVYAFSTENFRRSEEEVQGIMNILHQKCLNLLEEHPAFCSREKLDKHGVCIRIFGNLALLPSDVQKPVAEAALKTAKNNKAFLNICLAYTARDEICTAVQELGYGVSEGEILPEDINEHLLGQCLYTSKCPDPDLLVRTSGETRLSDFLLWQSSFSVLAFIKVLWPDFSIWHLFMAVIYYQLNFSAVKVVREKYHERVSELQEENDRQQALQSYANGSWPGIQPQLPNSVLEEYKQKRINRSKQFLANLEKRRKKSLEDIVTNFVRNANVLNS